MVVEAVACTADDAVQAERAGAGRIELVSAISEGGLTPSLGVLEEVKRRCRVPIVVMLRPRGGGFVYTDLEYSTMRRDAAALASSGADGLVVGMLTPSGEVDRDRLAGLMETAGGLDWIFHRALDVAADPFRALSLVIELGFVRVLTSGQAPSAFEGVERLRTLREHAAGRIEIMPGGGIRAANGAAVAIRSEATSLHLGPFVPLPDPWSGTEHLALDAEAVADVVRLFSR